MRKIKKISSQFFSLILIVFMLLSNVPLAFAETATGYKYFYPPETNPQAPVLTTLAGTTGLSGGAYLCANSSIADYSFGGYTLDSSNPSTNPNYDSSKEMKVGVLSNGSEVPGYSAEEYTGTDGNGVDILPNIEISFAKNVIDATKYVYINGAATTTSYLDYNKSKITLWKENADGTETQLSNTIRSSTTSTSLTAFFVSPENNLEYNTSYKIKIDSGIIPRNSAWSTATQSMTNATTYAYEIKFKTKAMTPVWASGEVLTATPSETSVQLNWPQPSNTAKVAGFQVLKNGTNITPTILPISEVGYTVTDLTAETGYTFTLNAVDSSNNILGSLTAQMTTTQATHQDTTPPSWTDKTLTATNFTATSITLTWGGAGDDSGIIGYRILANQNTVTSSIAGSSSSYTAISLTPGTAYTFKVEAKDAAGNWSTDGPEITASTLAPLGATDVAMTQGTAVNFEDGIIVTPTQLQGSGTVAVRNANSEVPNLPYDLYPSHGSYSATGSYYGVNVKADGSGPVPNKVVISVPVNIPTGTDLTKVGVHILDQTPTQEAQTGFNSWVYQPSTDLSEISKNIIKFSIENFDSQGQNVIFGVFYDPYPSKVVDTSKVVSMTDTSVTFRVIAVDFSGISKFSILRNGVYIGDNTQPIIRIAETGYQTTITDTPPGPGTYTYRIEAFDSFGNHSSQGDFVRTVQFGGDTSTEAMQAATIAALQDGSLIEYRKGESADCVTRSFRVPLNGVKSPVSTNISITWASSRPDVLSINNAGAGFNATVTKPVGENTVNIDITATVSGAYPSDAKTVVIPVTVKWLPEAYVESMTELNNAIANPLVKTILPALYIKWSDRTTPLVLDFQGKTLKLPVDKANNTIFAGYNATLCNATFDASGILMDGEHALIELTNYHTESSVSMDNITFIGTENSQYIIQALTRDVSITNCHFGVTAEAPIFIRNNANRSDTFTPSSVTITGCTFDNKGKPGYAVKADNGFLNMSNNTIKGYQGLINGSSSAGVLLKDDVNASLNDNTISGCADGVKVLTGDTVDYQTGTNMTTWQPILTQKTVYAQVNGMTIQDAAGAETAGAALVSGNLITPPIAEGSLAVDILNGADPANLAVLYQNASGSLEPPDLSADTTNNSLGQPIEITFTDDSAWTGAIMSVSLDGTALTAGSQYTVSAGKITIAAASFSTVKDYAVKVTATGYAPTYMKQSITAIPLLTPPVITISDILRTQSDAQPRGTANINFKDDPAWRSAITGITYEWPGILYKLNVNDSDYIITPGNISVSFDWFNMSIGKNLFIVHANGYADTSATMNNILQAPALVPDTSGNSAGQDIDIFLPPNVYDINSPYAFDISYMYEIRSIAVDGVKLNGEQCTVYNDGYIHIDGSVFPEAKNYIIEVKATGYTDATVTQEITAGVQSQVRVKADITDNVFGKPIDLTFTTDPDVSDWSSTITGISVNSVPLTAEQYTITSGQIELAAAAFPPGGTTITGTYTAGGRYTITIQSAKYSPVTVNQYVGSEPVFSPPFLYRDKTNTIVGNPIDVTFTDDPAWRSAINRIVIDDRVNDTQTDLTPDKYIITAGNIQFLPGVFAHAGSYYVRVFANGYYDKSVDQYIFNEKIMNPPDLTADSTNHVLSQAIDITFTDANWRYYISGVKVNDELLSSDRYQITAGNIQIAPEVFTEPGKYTITVVAPSAPGVYDSTTEYMPYSYYDAVVEQTILRPVYSVTVKDNVAYTSGENNGIKNMTVKDGAIGFKYFSINTTPIAPYAKDVVAVFVQLRNNCQIAISAPSVNCTNPSSAKAGFNVLPGDVIKVYIVDDLTNDNNRNPFILQ
ncbi:hypothetical protein JT05_11115 [Desulfosporosinus sp. Tol-M]|nr:hypothetical protein JT05_11115 [Desulfosporosinus sp. Tol-M]